MSLPFGKEQLAQLRAFCELCSANSSILHRPELAFVKSLIEKFGGVIPETTGESDKSNDTKEPTCEEKCEKEPEVSEPESEESDIELDNSGVIEPDTDEPQEMGNPLLEPSEEQLAESQEKRSEAMAAFSNKEYEKSVKLYTEAIKLNPKAPLLFAKRGQVYLYLNKPNACIRDCTQALELNPDSATAHKFRGRANRLLGKWEEAANDLRLACKFDFDEQADEWLREVTPNARKIEEHKRKQERKLKEKLDKKRKKEYEQARASASARASESTTNKPQAAGDGANADFYGFINDPEVREAAKDPEVAAAFQDISSNPMNIFKYQNNPKIMSLVNVITSKFAKMPDMGNMPGMGMFNANAANPPKSASTDDDISLD